MTAGYTELQVEIERREDGLEVTVAGDLDHHSAPALRRQLEQAAGEDVRTIVLDLAGVTFIDSAGLQVFIATTDRMQDRDGTLVISSTSPVVARILSVSRLGELFGQ